ncbi:MAG: exosortase C-terminal domain/associated protein EpsI [Candidatus Brocadia sp.]
MKNTRYDKINKNKKGLITIALLLFPIIYCFGFPKAKYESLNILSQLRIPLEMNGWQGVDVEQEWNIEDETYNFVSQALDREYVNVSGKNLFFLVLDAGNFHNPKVCSNSSGFSVRELNDIEFHISNHKFQAHSLYVEKDAEGFLIIYWICIDKNIVDWTRQKIKQLWFSLVNKKRASLMIRLDVPAKEDTIGDALKLAEDFIVDLGRAMPSDQASYIFGNAMTRSDLSLK